MTLSNVVTDTSAFGDTFAAKRGGLMSGTFSATGVLHDGTSNSSAMPHADDPGAPTDSNIAMSATGTAFIGYAADRTGSGDDSLWSCAVVVSSAAPTSSTAGESTMTISGETTGDISITWDEA
tara:strand:- start:2620 stop:2988 length:369 start_codon:yes stop_codon:yes gene_type:complete